MDSPPFHLVTLSTFASPVPRVVQPGSLGRGASQVDSVDHPNGGTPSSEKAAFSVGGLHCVRCRRKMSTAPGEEREIFGG